MFIGCQLFVKGSSIRRRFARSIKQEQTNLAVADWGMKTTLEAGIGHGRLHFGHVYLEETSHLKALRPGVDTPSDTMMVAVISE